jgi:hypothetical protein
MLLIQELSCAEQFFTSTPSSRIEKGVSTDIRHGFTVAESKLALDLSQSTRSSHMGSMIPVYHSSVRTMDPHALMSTSFP